jgi:hypothetical protein
MGNAAHGAGEPAVVELQGAAQVRTAAAVGVVPGGSQGRQFPHGATDIDVMLARRKMSAGE